MFKPAVFKAFIEEILPIPGPFTDTATSLNPALKAAIPASSAALVAAYGVDFFEPLKPDFPALPENKVLPHRR